MVAIGLESPRTGEADLHALCLIIGVDRGLAKAIASRLAQEGWHIGLVRDDPGSLRRCAVSRFKHFSPKGIHAYVIAVCGIVEPGGPFDSDNITREYSQLAIERSGLKDRLQIF